MTCGVVKADCGNDEECFYSSPTNKDEDQPVYQDIDDSSPLDLPQPSRQLKLRSPVPGSSPQQPKCLASPQQGDSVTYEEFDDVSDHYHLLEDNGSLENSMSPKPEEWYDDVGVDDQVVYTMNKNPPPVWRPKAETLRKPPLPPDRRSASPNLQDQNRKSLDLDDRRGKKLPVPKPGQMKPRPPPKPRPGDDRRPLSPADGCVGFLVKDDPKFKRKLQEKREELYGGNGMSRLRSMSMGEGEEFYECVLYTVDDAVAYEKSVDTKPPQLYPKTQSMLRDTRTGSPPPPPLPSRDPAPLTLHTRNHLHVSLAQGRQGSPSRQVQHGGSRQNSPLRQPCQVSPGSKHGSPLHQAQPKPLPSSPRHRSSTPTSPPPLPSRELLDPTLPSYTMPPALLRDAPLVPLREETPPPVPLRQSSHHAHLVSPPLGRTSPPSPHGRRRNSLPSPSHTPANRFQQPGSHTLKSPTKTVKSPPLLKQEATELEFYEDVNPDSMEGYEDVNPDNYEMEETYDDVEFGDGLSQSFSSRLEMIPVPVKKPATSPSRGQQKQPAFPSKPGVREAAPFLENATTAPHTRTRREPPHARARPQVPESTGAAPPLPPNKPRDPIPPLLHSKVRDPAADAPPLPRHKPRDPMADAPPLPPNKPRDPGPPLPPNKPRDPAGDAPPLPPNKPDPSENGPPLPPNKPDPVGSVRVLPLKPEHGRPLPPNKPKMTDRHKPAPAPKPAVAKRPAGLTAGANQLPTPPTHSTGHTPHPAVAKKPAPPIRPKPKALLNATPPPSNPSPSPRAKPRPAVRKALPTLSS